jgi:hypothetical protein
MVKTRMCFILLWILASTAAHAARPGEAWLEGLYDRVAKDLRSGAPLVVQVHVPLCEQTIIRCGNRKLGDGDNPDTNLYWATSGGFRGWFGRRGSAWTQVYKAGHEHPDILEVRIWRQRVQPTRTWRSRGVTRRFDVYVVAHAWRGKAIGSSMDAYVGDLFGDAPRVIELEGGVALRAGGAAHVVSYVGHNGWMDVEQYDWDAARQRARGPAKGTIAIACITKDYLADAVSAEERVPLIMTTSLMFAGAHGFEGAVSAFARGEGLSAIHRGAATNHALGQKKSLRAVWSAFTNPADKRWRH